MGASILCQINVDYLNPGMPIIRRVTVFLSLISECACLAEIKISFHFVLVTLSLVFPNLLDIGEHLLRINKTSLIVEDNPTCKHKI